MRRREILNRSPSGYPDIAPIVRHPTIPVFAQRGGSQLKAPKAILLVDSREQIPFDFSRFEGWFEKVKRKALSVGDYTVAGMEQLCVVERKNLPDLVRSLTTERCVFIKRLRAMTRFPHRLLVITAALSHVKSEYFHFGNPNRITQSLIAILAGLQIPFLCSETHELGEELVASYLYQIHLYHWLETNGYERFLADDDL